MRSPRTSVVSHAFALAALAATPLLQAAESPRSAETGRYRNLFSELLGKPEAEIAAKIQAAWQQLFYGDDATQRVYYPVGDDMAYVADVLHNDVRTEGQSYGMMAAVQLDKQAEFDRIWRWTKKYMLHESGPLAGYFAWHCRYDGTRIHDGPAPDGEAWFVTTLFFAAHRWQGRADALAGGPGELQNAAASRTAARPEASPYLPNQPIDYRAEAQALLRTMLHKSDDGDEAVTPMFDRTEKQIVFTPHPPGNRFTDPSYHLPAFWDLWARWADDPADRAFMAEAATISRDHFHRAAHPKTGLMPDYSHFDGRPYVRRGHDDFRFDAYRTLSNVALDWAWWGKDPWQIEQSNRVLAFLATLGPTPPNQLALDGTPRSDKFSPGLLAMAATAALAADSPDAKGFVQRLWDADVPSGAERYYDGLLHMFALLQVSGRYRAHHPSTP